MAIKKTTRKKKVSVPVEQPETPVEKQEAPPVEVAAVEESEAKKAFREYMERYKAEKPAKYALKESQFIQHLNSL